MSSFWLWGNLEQEGQRPKLQEPAKRKQVGGIDLGLVVFDIKGRLIFIISRSWLTLGGTVSPISKAPDARSSGIQKIKYS